MALIDGEGLRQTEVVSGVRLAGAELMAQYGKSRLKRIRRLGVQSRILRMVVCLSALFRGSTTSRNPAHHAQRRPDPSARLAVCRITAFAEVSYCEYPSNEWQPEGIKSRKVIATVSFLCSRVERLRTYRGAQPLL